MQTTRPYITYFVGVSGNSYTAGLYASKERKLFILKSWKKAQTIQMGEKLKFEKHAASLSW